MEFSPEYTCCYSVLATDGDFTDRMKPSALLRYAQQLATDHAAKIGLDAAYYTRTHSAFLLAKQALEFTRVPKVGELLTYTTLPERSKRASNKRITVVYDATGREVACVDSRWVLVDTESRRIIRHPPFEQECSCWGENVARELSLELPKAAPEALHDDGTRRALYSLCDGNGHLNNTCYLDLVCNALPTELLREKQMRRAVLTYHREVPMGESLSLQHGETAGGYYAVGVREGLTAFEAWCSFEA